MFYTKVFMLLCALSIGTFLFLSIRYLLTSPFSTNNLLSEQRMRDQRIIEEILHVWPYEETVGCTQYYLHPAIIHQISHRMEQAEKFNDSDYRLHDETIELAKREFISSIIELNYTIYAFLLSEGSEYNDYRDKIGIKSQMMIEKYDRFLFTCKRKNHTVLLPS
ncbi:hypothetical protein OGY07_02830 [Citrobacter sp. Cs237]|uniref:hypothetical protein n=2 Tax=Enterobacteriaceae TaxID=543 RepID=UPI001902251B|nr:MULTISPECIES: hypothetical protein [Citrobacter]MBJ9889705.1 hypothetical protein [Citrobacter sedlakii]MCK8144022.1 hypothetical protein [Citrobacter sedlakii]MCZ4675604.1 hypothetical protein [Citrobacter sedlakii]MDM2748287.1 hypothetical protein [Citrobacter sp. Cs237]MDR5005659.1 hypothetical protein [Citrobacter sedlakii]